MKTISHTSRRRHITMTVAELIGALRELPPAAPIKIYLPEGEDNLNCITCHEDGIVRLTDKEVW